MRMCEGIHLFKLEQLVGFEKVSKTGLIRLGWMILEF